MKDPVRLLRARARSTSCGVAVGDPKTWRVGKWYARVDQAGHAALERQELDTAEAGRYELRRPGGARRT